MSPSPSQIHRTVILAYVECMSMSMSMGCVRRPARAGAYLPLFFIFFARVLLLLLHEKREIRSIYCVCVHAAAAALVVCLGRVSTTGRPAYVLVIAGRRC